MISSILLGNSDWRVKRRKSKKTKRPWNSIGYLTLLSQEVKINTNLIIIMNTRQMLKYQCQYLACTFSLVSNSTDFSIFKAFLSRRKSKYFKFVCFFILILKYLAIFVKTKTSLIKKALQQLERQVKYADKLTSFLVIMWLLLFACAHFNALKAADEKMDSIMQTDSINHSVFDSIFNMSLDVLYSNPDSSRIIAYKAIEQASIDSGVNLIRALNLLGATHNLQSNFTKALDIYQDALKLSNKLKDTLRTANIYNNIAVTNLKIGNYQIALDYLHEAMVYYQAIGDVKSRNKTLSNIGLLYMDINNYEKAGQHFYESLQNYEKVHDSIGIANAFANLGILYHNMNNTDSALYYMDKSIELNKKLKNFYGLCVALGGQASLYLSNNNYDLAIKKNQQSLKIAKQIHHSYQTAMAHLGLAEAYAKSGLRTEGRIYADSAMEIAEQQGNKKLQLEAHKLYSLLFELSKSYDKSLEHYKKFITLEKELINQTKLHEIYNLEIEYLNQSKEIQQLEIQRQELLISRKNNTIIFIMVAFVLFMAGSYLFYLNNNHRRKANHQKAIMALNEKKSRAAIEAEIRERERIGQDIHDGLGQMLSVARLNISTLQQKANLSEGQKIQLLSTTLHSVDEAFYELRNISHNLAPSVLSSKGFIGALRDLVNQINQSKHITVYLEEYGLNGKLDGIVENTLYRAVQELVSNTIKHAGTKEIFIQIVKSEKEINLMVEDHGIGFNIELATLNPGSGLNNIRSRIENINGNLYIDSMPGRGSIISIIIPLKKSTYVKRNHKSINN